MRISTSLDWGPNGCGIFVKKHFEIIMVECLKLKVLLGFGAIIMFNGSDDFQW